MKYVNAYIVTRHYGGPEEGGWWFNAGEPLASVPVSDNGDPEVIREDLRVKFADLNRGNIYSVRGGEEVAVYIEEEFATYFPKERPHYE
jgi:hypothetical protein